MTTQPEALRLADALDLYATGDAYQRDIEQAADELRRLYELAVEQQAEPVAWMFQHDETGRMNYVSNDGMNTPELFLKGNPRYALVCPLYTAPPQQQAEPVSMRMPKVSDEVICLEDESLGTIVSLTAGGSPDIAFDDGSRGTYMLSEFAELFGYVNSPAAQPEQEPVGRFAKFTDGIWREVTNGSAGVPLYTTPPQRPWVGLTPEEVKHLYPYGRSVWGRETFEAIEKALKDKNT